MNYRKDIDGLRAVAVLPVVLFHAGFNFFSGGFVGVDVFFVISGYLITSIIAGEIAQERFSVLRFYERRIRRIFPALFAVLFAVMLAGFFILLPEDMKSLSRTLTAATLFASNFYFWKESGYFAPDAEMMPLLHTWSLAIEEQFYIFFPLFLMIVWRWGKYWKSLTWLGLLVSLGMSIYGARYHEITTFYLLPTRAWELLAGSVLALGAVPQINDKRVREVLAATGLLLIAYAVLTFTRTTIFPGENALFPCLGAALIIYAGMNGKETYTAKLLSLRPIVFFGLISYSLYLWHWPLIVFAKYFFIFPLTGTQSALVVVTSIILATLSWHYIEQPFRAGNATLFTRNRGRIFSVAGTVMSFAICLTLVTLGTNGFAAFAPRHALKIIEESDAHQQAVRDCMGNRENENYLKPAKACVFGERKDNPDMLIWGDSHAAHMVPAIMKATKAAPQGLRLLIMSGCPPILGVNLSSSHVEVCKHYNQEVIDYIKTGPEQTIILDGRWEAAIYGRTAHANATDDEPPTISREPAVALSKELALALFKERMKETMEILAATGKRIVIVYPVPESSYNVSTTLAYVAKRYGDAALDNLSIRKSDYLTRSGDITEFFNAERQRPNFVAVDPADRLCDDKKCIIYKDGHTLYMDDDHLSFYGAEFVSDIFTPLFDTEPVETLHEAP